MSNTDNLKDPLADLTYFPEFAKKLKINHWSPTQGNKKDGPWLYEYIVLTQEQRRSLPGNAAMRGGIHVGEVLQRYYADTIWRINPATKKIEAQKNKDKGRDKDELISEELQKFKDYEPVDEKDRLKKERYMDFISVYSKYGFLAIAETGAVSSPVTCEEQLTTSRSKHSDLLLPDLPIVQRTDMTFGESNSPTAILEFKTQWDKLGKPKKNGERSFLVTKSPAAPRIEHVMQCASYAAYYNFKVPVHLIYINGTGFKIFNASNCYQLQSENLKKYFSNLVNIFIRREKILSMFQDKDADEIILGAATIMEPYFDHNYAWNNFTNEMMLQAKKIFNFNDL